MRGPVQNAPFAPHFQLGSSSPCSVAELSQIQLATVFLELVLDILITKLQILEQRRVIGVALPINSYSLGQIN